MVNLLVSEFGSSIVVNAELEPVFGDFEHEGIKYQWEGVDEWGRGKVVQYASTETMCYSPFFPPAFGMRSRRTLGTIYFLLMSYIFIGIMIISDMFMEAIEEITSQQRTIQTEDGMGHIV